MIHEIGMTVAVGKVRSLCGLKVQVFIKEGHFLDDIAHFPAIGTGIHEHGTAKAAGNTDGKREAAQSMGASTLQIVWKVYLPEAKPSLILGGAISLVTILAYTAIAGTVGAGGLGDIAVRYGHQRGIPSVMWVTVVFLIILVQVVQLIFNWLSRRIDKRLDQPSGVPLKSKWVGTRSGRRLYSTNPAIIGSKQMTVVKINRFFSCFMVVRPFQIL